MDVVTYALLKSDIGGLKTLVESLQQGLDYKGSVATVDDLPNDAASGDSYTVSETGGQYVYDGTEWVRLNQDLLTIVGNLQTQMTTLESDKADKITTVNGQSLSDNVSLDAGDIPYQESETYPDGTVGGYLKSIEKETVSSILNSQIDLLFA